MTKNRILISVTVVTAACMAGWIVAGTTHDLAIVIGVGLVIGALAAIIAGLA